MFAVPGNGQAVPQANLYMQAEQASGVPVYPVMGNHECAGANGSNCGPDGANGVTENYKAFLNVILGGAGLPHSLAPTTGQPELEQLRATPGPPSS